MISIISGSARSNSNTLRVAKGIRNILKSNNLESTILDFEGYDIPNFNQKFDSQNLSDWQQNLVNHLNQSKVIFMLSPEYNWHPSAEIMQFINQFGSKDFMDIWHDKTFAMVGVSAGIGGRLPAIYLSNIINKIVSFIDADSVVHSKMFEVQNAAKVLDEAGHLLDNERFNTGFVKFVHAIVAS